MDLKKIIVIAVIAAAFIAFFALGGQQYLSLSYLQEQQGALNELYQNNQIMFLAGFFLLYFAVASFSLPGAGVLTLVAGVLFGTVTGVILVSFASTLGSTMAFLMSRFVIGDTVRQKYGESLKKIDQGIEKEGWFYLLTLRLIFVIPFFVINVVMGLTKMRTLTFMIVSQIGMLPGTFVYVYAGAAAGNSLQGAEGVGDLVSTNALIALGLLIALPFVAKFLLLPVLQWFIRRWRGFLQARKAYKGWDKPKNFDRNLVVIGGGSAGLVSSYIAAVVNAKVTLVEKHKMGGDCLNYGCVPSKAIIRSAKFLSHAKRAQEFGMQSADVKFAFADVMERVQNIIKKIEPHDSAERYEGLGVEVIQGTAEMISPWEVQITTPDNEVQTLTTRSIILGTGAAPLVPDIKGLGQVDYLTSDTIWDIREQPKRLVVLGGGPIGSELAQTFARLGTEVTQVEKSDRIMNKEDPDVSEMVAKRFADEGVDLRLQHQAIAIEKNGDQKVLICELMGDDGEATGQQVRIEFDQLLVALGRSARLEGFGIDTLGIKTGRTIEVDQFLATNYPNIFACGDAVSPYQFTHSAAHEAWYASVNALFGFAKKFAVDYSIIPWTTFTEPEVAHVGLNETMAQEQDIDYEKTIFEMEELDRAIAESETHGMVKVLTVPGKDKILGVTIVGEHAGDLLAEYVLAMKHGLGLNKIMETIHTYPTLAEANKYVAGEWKKAHKPERVLRWVEKLHTWRRH